MLTPVQNCHAKTFFETKDWVQIGVPRKIGHLGLSKEENVFAIEEGTDGNFSAHAGCVLDANLKKGVLFFCFVVAFVLARRLLIYVFVVVVAFVLARRLLI